MSGGARVWTHSATSVTEEVCVVVAFLYRYLLVVTPCKFGVASCYFAQSFFELLHGIHDFDGVNWCQQLRHYVVSLIQRLLDVQHSLINFTNTRIKFCPE